jgi:hypothetical protein
VAYTPWAARSTPPTALSCRNLGDTHQLRSVHCVERTLILDFVELRFPLVSEAGTRQERTLGSSTPHWAMNLVGSTNLR